MTCTHRSRTMALADGELGWLRRHVARRHLRDCAGCRAYLGELTHASSALRAGAPIAPLPAELRARIGAALDVEDARDRAQGIAAGSRPRDTPFRRGFLTGALTASLVAAAGLMVIVFGLPNQAAGLVDDHLTAVESNHLYDIPSSDRHTVRPWLARHSDVSPFVPDLTDRGFALLGGRIAHLGDRRIAVATYQVRQHAISVYAWPHAFIPWARTVDRRGVRSFCWTSFGLDYCAISDVQVATLAEFVATLRAADEREHARPGLD